MVKTIPTMPMLTPLEMAAEEPEHATARRMDASERAEVATSPKNRTEKVQPQPTVLCQMSGPCIPPPHPLGKKRPPAAASGPSEPATGETSDRSEEDGLEAVGGEGYSFDPDAPCATPRIPIDEARSLDRSIARSHVATLCGCC